MIGKISVSALIIAGTCLALHNPAYAVKTCKYYVDKCMTPIVADTNAQPNCAAWEELVSESGKIKGSFYEYPAQTVQTTCTNNKSKREQFGTTLCTQLCKILKADANADKFCTGPCE